MIVTECWDKKIDQIIYYVSLIAVFIFGVLYRAINQRYMGFILVPICLYYWYKNKKSVVDISLILLVIIFSIIGCKDYIDNPELQFRYSYIAFVWINPLVYYLGKAAVDQKQECSQKRTFGLMSALMIGMYITWALDYVMKYFVPTKIDMGKTWFVTWVNDYENRNTVDMGLLMLISGIFCFCMCRRQLKKCFYVFAAMEVVAIIINTINIGRQFMIYHLCTPLLLSFIYIVINWNYLSEKTKKILNRIWIGIAVVLAIGIVVIFANLKRIETYYLQSFWSADGGIIHNIRVILWKDSLIKMFKYPNGGWDAVASEYDWVGTSHNSWIEFGRYSGTIVFVLITIFILISFISGLKTIKNNGINNKVSYWCFGAMMLFFTYFFINDIGQLPRNFCIFYFFVCGVMKGNRVKDYRGSACTYVRN